MSSLNFIELFGEKKNEKYEELAIQKVALTDMYPTVKIPPALKNELLSMFTSNKQDSKIFRTFISNSIPLEEISETTGSDLKKKYPFLFNSFLGIIYTLIFN